MPETDTTENRTCKNCQQSKPLSSYTFHKRKNHYSWWSSTCKVCRAEYERNRRTYATTLKANIKRDFNLAIEYYDQLVAGQKNLCAICSHPPKEGERLHIDHDHNTSNIRGLLCRRCNLMLGFARDSQETLLTAAQYLAKSAKQAAVLLIVLFALMVSTASAKQAHVAALLLATQSAPTHTRATGHPTTYCCNPYKNPYVMEARQLRQARLHAKRKRRTILSGLPSRVLNTRFFARLTAYTGGDPSQGTGSFTALGYRARYGLVAVDPSVIPLGTWLYIPHYGLALAADTGGAVHGNHIDLCFGIGTYGSTAYARARAWAIPGEDVYVIPKDLVALFR